MKCVDATALRPERRQLWFFKGGQEEAARRTLKPGMNLCNLWEESEERPRLAFFRGWAQVVAARKSRFGMCRANSLSKGRGRLRTLEGGIS